MGLFDNVPKDAQGLSVTINFLDYEHGEELSTLAKNYFVKYSAQLGVKTISEYFAFLLFKQMKETMAREAAAQLMQDTQAKVLSNKAALEALEETIKNEPLVSKI
jgi:hypothetical protein